MNSPSNTESQKNWHVTLVLLGLSASIVSAYKLVTWTLFWLNPSITLESISVVLSLGGALAFLVWPPLIHRYGIRFMAGTAFLACLMGPLLQTLGYHPGLAILFVSGILVGYGGAAWLVTKNTLLPSIIHTTGLSDAHVAGLANVIFVAATLFWSIGGSYFAERFDQFAHWIIVWISLCALSASFLLRDIPIRQHMSFVQYGAWVKEVVRIFLVPIGVTAWLWAIITGMAQIFIEVGVHRFNQTFTEASLILIWATVGGILGNMYSMFWKKERWSRYAQCMLALGVLLLISDTSIDSIVRSGEHGLLSILAIAIGFTFGAAVNCMDGYYFWSIEHSRYKTIWAAVYWLMASAAIFLLMHLISMVKHIDSNAPFVLCSLLVFFLLWVSRHIWSNSPQSLN